MYKRVQSMPFFKQKQEQQRDIQKDHIGRQRQDIWETLQKVRMLVPIDVYKRSIKSYLYSKESIEDNHGKRNRRLSGAAARTGYLR